MKSYLGIVLGTQDLCQRLLVHFSWRKYSHFFDKLSLKKKPSDVISVPAGILMLHMWHLPNNNNNNNWLKQYSIGEISSKNKRKFCFFAFFTGIPYLLQSFFSFHLF